MDKEKKDFKEEPTIKVVKLEKAGVIETSGGLKDGGVGGAIGADGGEHFRW